MTRTILVKNSAHLFRPILDALEKDPVVSKDVLHISARVATGRREDPEKLSLSDLESARVNVIDYMLSPKVDVMSYASEESKGISDEGERWVRMFKDYEKRRAFAGHTGNQLEDWAKMQDTIAGAIRSVAY